MSEKNIVQNEVNNGDIDVISSPASTSTPGVAYFNPEDFTVDSDGYVSSRQKVGAIQYIGTIIEEGDSSLIWNITRDISPKKLSDVKLNDLILLAEDYGEYEAGLVFAVSALIYPELQTKKTAEFSIRGANGTDGKDGKDGADGKNGTDGTTPVITATAGIDQTTGTAKVTVTKDNDSVTNPNFKFEFSGIKGETGEKGDKGADGKDAAGYVAMEVVDGCLYCITSIDTDIQDFELEDGNLIMEVA